MPPKILIVDDDREITEVIQRFLEKEHYKVSVATSAEEALAELANNPVDVVISDEQMPGMLGTEFLQMVRGEYPDTVRILLTGHANLDTAIRAINEAGVCHFFTKPCNFADLSVIIGQAVLQKNMLSESRQILTSYKENAAAIKKIEHRFPGVTMLDKTQTGSIIIDDTPDDNKTRPLDTETL